MRTDSSRFLQVIQPSCVDDRQSIAVDGFQFCKRLDGTVIDEIRAKAVKRIFGKDVISLERYGLVDLSVSFPEDYRGRRYCLELADSRHMIGCLEASEITRIDTRQYAVVLLTDQTTFEFVRNGDQSTIYLDGKVLGFVNVVASWEFSCLAQFSCPHTWSLIHQQCEFGTIVRPYAMGPDDLFIERPDGVRLPVSLAMRSTLWDIILPIWRIVSLRCLFTPPPPNPNRVICRRDVAQLTEMETIFYFAICLFFRALVFGFDFSDPGG